MVQFKLPLNSSYRSFITYKPVSSVPIVTTGKGEGDHLGIVDGLALDIADRAGDTPAGAQGNVDRLQCIGAQSGRPLRGITRGHDLDLVLP